MGLTTNTAQSNFSGDAFADVAMPGHEDLGAAALPRRESWGLEELRAAVVSKIGVALQTALMGLALTGVDENEVQAQIVPDGAPRQPYIDRGAEKSGLRRYDQGLLVGGSLIFQQSVDFGGSTGVQNAFTGAIDLGPLEGVPGVGMFMITSHQHLSLLSLNPVSTIRTGSNIFNNLGLSLPITNLESNPLYLGSGSNATTYDMALGLYHGAPPGGVKTKFADSKPVAGEVVTFASIGLSGEFSQGYDAVQSGDMYGGSIEVSANPPPPAFSSDYNFTGSFRNGTTGITDEMALSDFGSGSTMFRHVVNPQSNLVEELLAGIGVGRTNSHTSSFFGDLTHPEVQTVISNYRSRFEVTGVPEPGSLLTAVILGGWGVLQWRRRPA
jgi:hypothetical protein